MDEKIGKPPIPKSEQGLAALRALWQERSVLAALSALHREMGDIFQIPLPGFNPVVMVGPEANRFVLVSGREKLLWRNEVDPVVDLLHRGVLVIDGDSHDSIRKELNPSIHRRMVAGFVETMITSTDEVVEAWQQGQTVNMLDEMRKIALLILMRTVFGINFQDRIGSMWDPILKNISYISPGLWVVWPGVPRLGYRSARKKLDAYLFEVIQQRRRESINGDDLLSYLVFETGMPDELIRDQLLTLLIAGHDTSTASLAWTLYLLGKHPDWMRQVAEEVDTVSGSKAPTIEILKSLPVLDRVSKEALRLYPPIHLGARVAAEDLEFNGYHIPAGQRVVYSIYLSHRHPAYWDAPDTFNPDRFLPEKVRERPHYVYLPFGGGLRNCIGFSFAQVELPLVLARIFQRTSLQLSPRQVHRHMGATLEPRPGVFMKVEQRKLQP